MTQPQKKPKPTPAPPEKPAATDELPTEVTLKGAKGGLKIRLIVPESQGLRYETTYAWVKSDVRASMAALGLCSASIRKHVRFNHNVLQFGGEVLDWLLAEGVSYLDAIEAGKLAWVHVSRGLVSGEEISEVEVFTAPPGGASSSSG